jgi:NAD(P)-dependent dehydrogenase (short-subunit alcohol dehydrogenase family)
MDAALIVGATGDVGRAVALALAAAGHPVALAGRDPARLDAVAAECRALGVEAQRVVADLRDPAAPEGAVAQARAALGPIGVLVNAAGIFGPLAPLAESDPDSWAQTLQVNALAPYRFARALVPDMVRRRSGRIVNVSSLAVLSVPTALNSAYATSKVALNAWTSVLALELGGTGVTANAIHPGDLKSRMWAEIGGAATATAGAAGAAGALGAQGFAAWADHVGTTGGDDPAAAGRFVAGLVSDPAQPTGRFFLLGAQAQVLAPHVNSSLTPTVVPG